MIVTSKRHPPGSTRPTPPPRTTSTEQKDFAAVMNDPSFIEAMKIIGLETELLVAQQDDTDEDEAVEKKTDTPAAKEGVLHMDDVIGNFDRAEWLKDFTKERTEFRAKLMALLRNGVACLTSISDVQEVIKNFTASNVSIDTSSMTNVFERSIQSGFLNLMLDTLDVNEDLKRSIVEQHAARVWGPEPMRIPPIKLPDVSISVDASRPSSRLLRGGTIGEELKERRKQARPAIGLSSTPY